MHKLLIIVILIFFAVSGVSAKEIDNSDDMIQFAYSNIVTKENLARKLLEKTVNINEEPPINSCCFGCPAPLDIVLLPNYFYLLPNPEIRLVTKTKSKYLI